LKKIFWIGVQLLLFLSKTGKKAERNPHLVTICISLCIYLGYADNNGDVSRLFYQLYVKNLISTKLPLSRKSKHRQSKSLRPFLDENYHDIMKKDVVDANS
jgi:hypothetical protein